MKVLDYDGLEYYNDLIENKYAPLSSPALTGTPTAPTPTAGDDSTKIATTAFVNTKANDYLPLSGGTLTGALTINQSGNTPLTLQTTAGYNDIQVTDGTNRIGVLRFSKDTTNSYNKLLLGVVPYGDNTAPSGFEISRDSSGNIITSASTISATTTLALNRRVNNSWTQINGGNATADGASLILFGKGESRAGAWQISANNGSTSKTLSGKADGTLQWGSNNVLTDATVGTILEASTSADVSISASVAKNITSLTIPKGTWVITGHARFDNVTSGKAYGAMFGATSNSYNSNNDSAIYVHSTSTTPISIQTTRIIVQNSQATVYFVGYANAACKVLSGATFRAVRIK